MFLFSETQIVKEAFLEDINNILNSGDVPNLYAPDEMERIVNGVRPAVKAAGKLDTRDAIFAHYVQTVRARVGSCGVPAREAGFDPAAGCEGRARPLAYSC